MSIKFVDDITTNKKCSILQVKSKQSFKKSKHEIILKLNFQ